MIETIVVLGLPLLTIIGFTVALFYKAVKTGNRLHNKFNVWLND